MPISTTDFNKVKRAFNNIRVMKGEYVALGTCDSLGNPNVAPIGSMRIVDDVTVHVLQGFLPRTFQNLKENPKAVFSVRTPDSIIKELFSFNKSPEDEAMGFRVHASFKGTNDSPLIIAREIDAIAHRVPRLMRRPFRRFCDAQLRRLLIFSMDEIRIIGGVA